jgi:hypothetical protein
MQLANALLRRPGTDAVEAHPLRARNRPGTRRQPRPCVSTTEVRASVGVCKNECRRATHRCRTASNRCPTGRNGSQTRTHRSLMPRHRFRCFAGDLEGFGPGLLGRGTDYLEAGTEGSEGAGSSVSVGTDAPVRLARRGDEVSEYLRSVSGPPFVAIGDHLIAMGFQEPDRLFGRNAQRLGTV